MSIDAKSTGTGSDNVPRSRTRQPASVEVERLEDPANVISNGLPTTKQVPPWYSQPYILSGYRPVKHSVSFSLRSLAYLHSETVNIYTHLLPALIALAAIPLVSEYFNNHLLDATRLDRLMFEISLCISATCFLVSAIYHTLLCHSEYYFDLWVRIDYAAILVQIPGSFISGIYVGFYCEPNLQVLYWSMISVLAVLTAFVVINPRLQGPRWRHLRTEIFVATGLSAFIPIIHAATLFPYWQLHRQAGLRYYYVE